MCIECYSEKRRVTPLLNPLECLREHRQYICGHCGHCGHCGRCICIEHTKNGLQRWNFPFKSLEIASYYLRVADYSMKTNCGIYQIKSDKGRVSYKIFANRTDLEDYLKKHPDKSCDGFQPSFSISPYQEFPETQVRKLRPEEVEKYMSER